MPLYDARCSTCGTTHEFFARVADRHDTPVCCGAPAALVISPPMIQSDIEPYRAVAVDVATGKPPVIGSRAEHREYLKRNGYVELGNDKPRPKAAPRTTTAAADVKQAIDQVRSGSGARDPAGTGVNVFAP